MTIFPLFYLPNINFFIHYMNYPNVCFEKYENFPKQTYRNRTRILTANKTLDISVPIQGNTKTKPYKDVKISYQEDWAKKHIKSIETAYRKAPFYDFFAEDFFKIISSNHTFLIDLNTELLTKCLYFLQLKNDISFTDEYLQQEEHNQLNNKDLRNYNFNNTPKSLKQFSYYQLFGSDFEMNVSIIDLLFNEGPQSILKLKLGVDLLNNPRID